MHGLPYQQQYQSVEQIQNLTGKTCKGDCNQTIRLIPDKEKPVRYFKHHRDQGLYAFTVGWPLMKDPDRLCYYHRKMKQGLFNNFTEFQKVKMQKKIVAPGKGGTMIDACRSI